MGAATIIQQSLSENSASFWSKMGPKIPSIPLNIENYNRGFVNFCMVVGLITTIKLGVCGLKKLNKALHPNKALPKQAFLQRYGEGSWALIADVAHNEQYCIYLAKMGINLILMGDESNFQIVRDMIQVQGAQVKTITIPVDWSQKDYNYEELTQKIKDYDISFLVLPKMEEAHKQSSFGTHVQEIPPYEHYYLLVRHLGPLLHWRSYQSAIILPSTNTIGQIKRGNGVKQGILSALDGFMRTLNFEMKDSMDIIASRETVQQCFKDLGKKPVSQ